MASPAPTEKQADEALPVERAELTIFPETDPLPVTDRATETIDAKGMPQHSYVYFQFLSSHRTSKYAMVILTFQLLFSGCMNGFLSFSIIPLRDLEGFSYTHIGAFIPISAAVNICFSIFVGTYSGTFSHKALFLGACFLTLSGSFACVTGIYPLMLIGFGLTGGGYGIMTVLPFVQCKLYGGSDSKSYRFWFFIMNLVVSGTAGLGRVLMMGATTVMHRHRFGWRLPWISVGCIQCIVFVGLMCTPIMGPGPHSDVAVVAPEEAPEPVRLKNRRDLIKQFYGDVNSSVHALARIPVVFAMSCITIWYPAISAHLFPEIEDARRNAMVLGCLLLSAPLGLVLTGLTLTWMQSIKSSVRGFWMAAVASALSLFVMVQVKNIFVFCAMLLIYVVAQFFPCFFVKQLPYALGHKGEVAVFGVSQLVWLQVAFGDICGTFIMGVEISGAGFDVAMWLTFIVLSVGCGIHTFPFLMSFLPHGFVHKRALVEEEELRLEKCLGKTGESATTGGAPSCCFGRVRRWRVKSASQAESVVTTVVSL